MYELWAKKIDGDRFEHIMDFENIDYQYTATDMLDRDVYKEAMVMGNEHCILYREFGKVKKIGVKKC